MCQGFSFCSQQFSEIHFLPINKTLAFSLKRVENMKKNFIKALKPMFAASLMVILGGICFAENDGYYLEIDEYLGQPVEIVEAALGTPLEDDIDTIYADYKNDSLLDPEYSMYFPSGELKEGVKVRILVWETSDIHSIVWAKEDLENHGNWIVFTSVAHDDNYFF